MEGDEDAATAGPLKTIQNNSKQFKTITFASPQEGDEDAAPAGPLSAKQFKTIQNNSKQFKTITFASPQEGDEDAAPAGPLSAKQFKTIQNNSKQFKTIQNNHFCIAAGGRRGRRSRGPTHCVAVRNFFPAPAEPVAGDVSLHLRPRHLAAALLRLPAAAATATCAAPAAPPAAPAPPAPPPPPPVAGAAEPAAADRRGVGGGQQGSAMQKSRTVRLGFGTARQKRVLE
jgi:hypothetical protein